MTSTAIVRDANRSSSASPRGQTFESSDPGSGALIGTFPVAGDEEVAAAVTRARSAALWWGALSFDDRGRRLRALVAELAQGIEDLADLVHRENGKPLDDARIEIILAIDHLAWAAKNARRVLGLRRTRTTLLTANQTAWLEYRPFGVVGVIGPWNYPVHTPMGSISYALAAGNAVVYKPSEYTPAVARWLADAATRAVPEQPILQVVTGLGETGAALCRSRVDKIAFTGSARTGRRIAAQCADSLTPVVLELGGKDAVIVAEDADVEAAARSVVWGALQNAGQACVSIERVYVVDAVYDAFERSVVRRARSIRAGSDRRSLIGPITMPAQVEVIRRHLEDALSRGARALVGGRESIHGVLVDPVVLTDVPPGAPVLTEETFGPVLPLVRVRDVDEAVELANDSVYGLGSAVFSKRNGLAIAKRLRCGMTSVNTTTMFAGVPSLPFGGVGDSGYGRIHGDDGLREFTFAHAITDVRFPLPFDVAVFDKPARAVRSIGMLLGLRYRRPRG